MYAMTAVQDTLALLDNMECEPTDFEAGVLETVTRQVRRGRLPSVAQHRILCEMIEKYLQDPAVLRTMLAVAP